jgi:hypothetical protein
MVPGGPKCVRIMFVNRYETDTLAGNLSRERPPPTFL